MATACDTIIFIVEIIIFVFFSGQMRKLIDALGPSLYYKLLGQGKSTYTFSAERQ